MQTIVLNHIGTGTGAMFIPEILTDSTFSLNEINPLKQPRCILRCNVTNLHQPDFILYALRERFPTRKD